MIERKQEQADLKVIDSHLKESFYDIDLNAKSFRDVWKRLNEMFMRNGLGTKSEKSKKHLELRNLLPYVNVELKESYFLMIILYQSEGSKKMKQDEARKWWQFWKHYQ